MHTHTQIDYCDLARRNIAGIITLRPSTQRWMHHAYKSLAATAGNDISKWTPTAIYNWHQALLLTMSAVSANSQLRAIRIMCARLSRMCHIEDNPARHVPFATEPHRQPKAVRPETYHSMRATLKHPRDIAIIDTLWESGCRISELRTIEGETADMWETADGRLCAALRVVGKFGKSRMIYSKNAESLATWLREKPRSNAVFCSLKRPYQVLSLSAIQSILRRSRRHLPPNAIANAHAFRHAFAIRKLDEGHDLAAVSAWLGHADPSFTARVYVIRREDELRRKFFG